MSPAENSVRSVKRTFGDWLTTAAKSAYRTSAFSESAGSAFAERHLHVLDLIDRLAIGFDVAVGDAHGQAAGLDGFGEVDIIGQHPAVGAGIGRAPIAPFDGGWC